MIALDILSEYYSVQFFSGHKDVHMICTPDLKTVSFFLAAGVIALLGVSHAQAKA